MMDPAAKSVGSTQRLRVHREGTEWLNGLSGVVIGAAIAVHKGLGPGLLESVYERCLSHELAKLGVPFLSQVQLPISYDTLKIEGAFRLDLWVAERLVVEVKAVQETLPIHEAQLLTYVRLSNSPLGLLLNFNVPVLSKGVRRIAHPLLGPCGPACPLCHPARKCA